jgi:uncharacterized protein YggE
MTKLFISIFSLLVVASGFSQTKPSNEIVAEGGAKIKIKPDLATFTLTIEKTDTIEKTAISELNRTVDGLIKSLTSIGFENQNIKIANYDISSSNEEHKKRYAVSNILKIDFRIDNKLIDAFYTEIQQAGIGDLEVSFEATLSDSLEKVTRLKLVQQAIEDAKINAANISQVLGVRLGKVKQVHKYGEGFINAPQIEMVKFTPPIVKRDTEIKYNTAFDKFQVEDEELEEKITIVLKL